jgi:hypothetical protein
VNTHAETVQTLRDYATHFAPRDWNYTRQVRIKHIRYEGDWTGDAHPLRRLHRTLSRFVRIDDLERMLMDSKRVPWAWKHPLITLKTGLRTERHLPDGQLDNGGVLTYWEETGEYLQMVQPSVGALIADLLDAHPDLPEVQAVVAEIQRILDGYAERVKAGEVE